MNPERGEKWKNGLSSRVIAALAVAYKHRDGRCDAVVREPNPASPGMLHDRCVHLTREIIPEALAAADEAEASELVAVRSALRSLVDAIDEAMDFTSGAAVTTFNTALDAARNLLDAWLPDGFVPLDAADYANQEVALDGLSETPETP